MVLKKKNKRGRTTVKKSKSLLKNIKAFLVKIFNKSFKLDVIDILIIIVVVCGISSLGTGFIIKHQYEKNTKINSIVDGDELDKFVSIYNEVINKYYEEVDSKGLVDSAIDGMLDHLEDKYSIYIENDTTINEELDSTYEGIGIVTIENVVYNVYEGSSAYREGVKVGDIIVSVNGYSINKDNYHELSKKLKENDGTNEIGVLRGKEELAFKVTVETIVIPTVSSKIYSVHKKNIAYIDIDSFARNTYEEFQNKMIELSDKDIDGMIIDLRNNSGGYVKSASDIANEFLKKGKTIYSLKHKEDEETIKDNTDAHKDYKVVVLVNKSTASSAEILAASLKDSYGAVIVGNTTYGKGSVQTVKYYESTAIKYTSALWYRPNGESVDGVGINPDYEVDNKIVDNVLEDKQFDKALQLFK